MDDGARPVPQHGLAVDSGFDGEVAAEAADDRADGRGEMVVSGGDEDLVSAEGACDQCDVRSNPLVSFQSMPMAKDGDHRLST